MPTFLAKRDYLSGAIGHSYRGRRALCLHRLSSASSEQAGNSIASLARLPRLGTYFVHEPSGEIDIVTLRDPLLHWFLLIFPWTFQGRVADSLPKSGQSFNLVCAFFLVWYLLWRYLVGDFWYMLACPFALVIIFLAFFDFVKVSEFDLTILPEYQHGVCYLQAATQTETGSGQTGLVPTPSWYPTLEFLEIVTDLSSTQCPSFQGCEVSQLYCISNDDCEPRPLEVPSVQTAPQKQCDVLRHMPPPAMAKRDRPVLCSRLEEVAAERPRSVLPNTMAGTTRLASALAIDFGSWPNSFATPEAKTKKCKREQDAQESTAGCTTDATYDDAGHATQCIPWTSSTSSTSSTDASNVSSADDAVPYAGDIAAAATSRHTMASTTSTVYGQDASLDACPHDLSNHADNASSCDAENACRTSTFGNRYGRRSAGPYVYDEGKTGGTSTGHATESAESSDQIWSTNLYGSTCRSDSPGQCKSKLRRSSPGQKSAPRHVEEVPLRRSATLTELRGAVHGPGEKAPGAGEHPQGVAHRSQAKPVEKSKVAKLDSGEVQNITSDEETEDQEASNATNAVTILTETMEGLAQSLDSLHREAEVMVAEQAHAAKRQRTMQPKKEDQNMDAAHGSGPPFGKAG